MKIVTCDVCGGTSEGHYYYKVVFVWKDGESEAFACSAVCYHKLAGILRREVGVGPGT